MDLEQEPQQRVVLRHAGQARGHDAAGIDEDQQPLRGALQQQAAGLLLHAEELHDLGGREVAEVALERHESYAAWEFNRRRGWRGDDTLELASRRTRSRCASKK